jgi:hypothetical protein
MSQAHVRKLFHMIETNAALAQAITNGATSDDIAIARAVAVAKREGLDCTPEEVRAQVEAARHGHAGGELSDQQLEAVAGGSGSCGSCLVIGQGGGSGLAIDPSLGFGFDPGTDNLVLFGGGSGFGSSLSL